jgi:hypothetical protein
MYTWRLLAAGRQAGARGDAAALGFLEILYGTTGCKKKKQKKKNVSSSSCELL